MNGAERLLYGQIENIIVQILWIREDLRPVLRARLRHLERSGFQSCRMSEVADAFFTLTSRLWRC